MSNGLEALAQMQCAECGVRVQGRFVSNGLEGGGKFHCQSGHVTDYTRSPRRRNATRSKASYRDGKGRGAKHER
jgi:hypothetical protein